MGEGRVAYRVMVGNPDGNMFWKTRHRREDNIKMDSQAVLEGVAWHALTQDRHK
jgi:hypothetical protein